ncbi:Hypothetical predicted protein [Mytilus galloprovincialis]|uniref:ribonuclease H n=1 Tax=Mytilus galloprovincialis TaxID=29158 RepID=A0A8B6G9M0_MYTGA|nr:Hypothetical predicted protein [Mytilus galloprovincialis]
MKSTPIKSMEDITNIPPLGKRRECKAMIQATKYQCSQDHPMNTRLKQLSSGRLKRSSFTLETRALQRKHQEALPKYIEPIVFTMNNTPCEEKLGNVTIQTSVPLITTRDEQTSNVKKILTMSMLEEQYPSETWVRVYTDGSATNATTNGGAGIYIKYPNGDQQSEAIPTGLHCSNYKAEEEAITHAAHSILNKIDDTSQVVFLTDALSVLQALKNDKLPQLQQALYNIKSLTTVIQWIPSHCGVWGNEQADRLAKYGAEQQQEENPVCFSEMKTIIKSLFNTPQQQDSYHQLTRSEQTTIFRLRTGHNRLNLHLHKVMKVVPSPMCPCGEAEQDTAHLLQSCNLHQALRDKIWHSVTSLEKKLYGPVDSLQKTTRFVEETGIQV